MSTLNLTNSSSLNGTGDPSDQGDDGMDFSPEIMDLLYGFDASFDGSIIVFAYAIFTLLVVFRLGIYRAYPACALRWTVYYETLALAAWGIANKAYNASAGTVGLIWSCKLLRFVDIFTTIGVIFCGTICANGFNAAVRSKSRVSTNDRKILGNWKYAGPLMLFSSLGPAIISAVFVFQDGPGCTDSNRFYLIIQTTMTVMLFLLQVYYIFKGTIAVSNIFKVNPNSSVAPSSKPESTGSSRSLNVLKTKFLIILATLFISWFPMALQELYEILTGISVLDNWILTLGLNGRYVGTAIDCTLLLYNPHVKNYFTGKSTRQLDYRSQASTTTTRVDKAVGI